MTLSPRSVLKVGRWILTGLVLLSLFSVGRSLFETEMALPSLRAEAEQGLRQDATADQLYSEGLDSLGVRLSRRQSLSAETDSVAYAALNAQIEVWQSRMGNIIRYRALAAGISTFRLYSWVAIVLLSLLLTALLLIPRLRARSRKG